MYHCIFFIVSFEKSSQKLVLPVSSGVPNTSQQQKHPAAFICFSVFGTLDETLALVFDILHEIFLIVHRTFL